MPTWLVCRKCRVKEWIQAGTKFVPCQTCGAQRFAAADDGTPMFVFSCVGDAKSFDIKP